MIFYYHLLNTLHKHKLSIAIYVKTHHECCRYLPLTGPYVIQEPFISLSADALERKCPDHSENQMTFYTLKYRITNTMNIFNTFLVEEII